MVRKITVHRKGYRRRDGTYVRPATFKIRDRGRRGRGKKVIEVRKGIMKRWAVKFGYIRPDQKVGDIPAGQMDNFARELAVHIGEREARGMFQSQLTLRKRQPNGFKGKMRTAVNAL